jgi:hypothetical protein
MKRLILLLFATLMIHALSAQNQNVSNGQYFDGEPYMAIDPHNDLHIVAAWIGFTVGVPTGIKTKVSMDGGLSWSASVFLPHAVSIFHSADPSIGFDTAGNVYACYIDSYETPDSGGIYVVGSIDGGLSWGTPHKVMDVYDDGSKLPLDRPWFCINPVTNHFYVTSKPAPWIPAPNRPYFRTSSDGGITWAPWRYIDTTGYLVGNLIAAPMAAPAVGSDGVFHCVYPSYLSSQNILPGFIHASSTNDGNTFTYHGKYINTGSNTDTLPKMGYNLAVDPSNPLHLAFNFPAKLSNTDIDIWTMESTDGGSTWTNPLRVNDDPVNNGVMQDLTWCHLDINGDLIVGWRDRRNGGGSGYSVPSEIWGAVKRIDSAGFSPNFRISDTIAQFNATYLDANGNDFMNIALHNDTMYAIWGDVRTNVLSIWFNRRGMTNGSATSGILLTDEAIPAVSLYPNPSQNMLYLSGERVNEVLIYDMNGQLLSDQQLKVQQVNTTMLAKGIYNIQCKTDKGNTTQRFVKD